jgi:hypothetical protein
LQKLPFNFAKLLKDRFFYEIVLCGDAAGKFNFSVKGIADPNITYLAYSWKEFCSANYFNVGDNIRFKFNLSNSDGNFQVYKLIA